MSPAMAGSVLGFRVRLWLLSAFAGGGRGRKIEEHFEVLEHDGYCVFLISFDLGRGLLCVDIDGR